MEEREVLFSIQWEDNPRSDVDDIYCNVELDCKEWAEVDTHCSSTPGYTSEQIAQQCPEIHAKICARGSIAVDFAHSIKARRDFLAHCDQQEWVDRFTMSGDWMPSHQDPHESFFDELVRWEEEERIATMDIDECVEYLRETYGCSPTPTPFKLTYYIPEEEIPEEYHMA